MHQAFLHRQAADYGTEETLLRNDIDTLLTHAREFVAAVREYFESRPVSEW